ncbi:hypothetical protein ACRE_029740 [Hapsidospora chrysogenum ATCC 11550]|uniref:Uncharacterized protein n=1 Tax=Hapsidospora chrysogenum (strain ATCC 11550 / CBS 779.69 / DSM 880 / IAM 14645 / JCM 23072 / IMI 49137) TaxID=857340 RepID=A0A086TA14_HAPC1|nr:hypothetical protein ACRE_029740 [Hapsidospora chrysogenum ATCC 11550]
MPLLVDRPSVPSNIQILRQNFETLPARHGIPESPRGLFGAGKTDEEIQPNTSSTNGGITMLDTLDEGVYTDCAKLAALYQQASESARVTVLVT